MRRRLFAALVIPFIFSSALAEDHPNDARGFAPERVFDFHDLDHVNLFNGNLVIAIPLGPQYRANAALTYRFSLIYNSHVWHFESAATSDPNNPQYIASPIHFFNAGLGWSLSLGRLLFGPDTAGEGVNYVFETPDGAQHALYPAMDGSGYAYSNDMSYFRMHFLNSTLAQVDAPDGTSYLFTGYSSTVPCRPSLSAVDWRLTSIGNGWANYVGISYTDDDPQWKQIWTIRDGEKTATAYFASTASCDLPMVLDHLDLPGPGGATSSYFFTSETDSVPLPLGDTSGRTSFSFSLPLLTSIRLPSVGGVSGSTYQMRLSDGTQGYETTPGTPPYATNPTSGVLKRLVLPTLGSLQWTYERSIYPSSTGLPQQSPAIQGPVVVSRRSTYDATNTLLGTWTYGRGFTSPEMCTCPDPPVCSAARQQTVWVTAPAEGALPAVTTVNYFSVFNSELDSTCAQNQGWTDEQYGLPYTRYAKSSDRYAVLDQGFLSREVRTGFDAPNASIGPGAVSGNGAGTLVRSEYALYDWGGVVGPSSPHEQDQRQRHSATFYDDKLDNMTVHEGCGGGTVTCFSATNLFNYNFAGKYRQTSTDGNFQGKNFRTEFTNYPAAPSTTNRWLLNTWTEQCIVEDTSARVNQVTDCSQLTGAAVTRASFDLSTGGLNARRVLSQSPSGGPPAPRAANDLLSTFTYDISGRGDLLSEQYFGGDTQMLGIGDDFTPPAGNPTYRIDYVNVYSVGGRLSKRKGSYVGGSQVILTKVDEDYDPFTGLTTAARDSAGVQTGYQYDERWRLKTVFPPAEVATNYVYNDAQPGAPAIITVTRQPGGTPPPPPVRQTYVYDSFGRLVGDKRLMPNGTTSVVQTTYDAQDRKISMSSRAPDGTANPPRTTFSNFDAFGNPQTITAPDNTVTSERRLGGRYFDRTQTIVMSGGLQPATTKEIYDRFGRLLEIKQSTDSLFTHVITTDYAYDVLGRLTTVTASNPDTGPPTQTRTFSYDNRGFLSGEQHPENGITGYGSYDARGHVVTKTVNSANDMFDLKYSYDQAERLLTVSSRNPSFSTQFRLSKEFTYGASNSGSNLMNGKLVTAKRHNYQPIGDIAVTETYGYNDLAGRLTDKTTMIVASNSANSKTLAQSYHYNDLGLRDDITYPTTDTYGSPIWGDVQPGYTSGFLTAVSQPAFASGISYWPSGMINTITHFTGTVPLGTTDVYSIDTGTYISRPSSISFQSWNNSCVPPSISPSGQPQNVTIVYGSGTTLSVTATGTNLTYQWLQGQNAIPGGTASTLTVSPTQTTGYSVRILNGCGRADSNQAVVTVQPQAPTSLHVLTQSTSALSVSWSAVPAADHYELQRLVNNVWSTISINAPNPYADTSVSLNATYVYQVRAIAVDFTPSPYSNRDVGTTMTFSTVSSGMPLLFTHVNELLSAVNAVRAAGGAAAVSWSQIVPAGVPIPAAGVKDYASYISSLRATMDNALQVLLLPTSAYTDPNPAGAPIRAVHISEVQDRARHRQ